MPDRLGYRVIILFLFVMVLILPEQHAAACSCAYPPPPPKKAMGESDFVFMGTVKEIRKSRVGKEVLFDVQTTWKGVDQTQALIMTSMGGGDCGFRFEEGKRYIVYGGDMYPFEGKWSTNTCTRTRELAKAQEDQIALGEGEAPTEQVDLEKQSNRLVVFLVGVFVVFGILIFRIGRAIR